MAGKRGMIQGEAPAPCTVYNAGHHELRPALVPMHVLCKGGGRVPRGLVWLTGRRTRARSHQKAAGGVGEQVVEQDCLEAPVRLDAARRGSGDAQQRCQPPCSAAAGDAGDSKGHDPRVVCLHLRGEGHVARVCVRVVHERREVQVDVRPLLLPELSHSGGTHDRIELLRLVGRAAARERRPADGSTRHGGAGR
eukprot:scaffold77397_cov61-Phaeocystis_antarctica.AAC.5